MCLIAFVPKGKSLTRDVIDKANQVNPDGIGVMSQKGVEKFYGNKQLKRARSYINALAAEGIGHAVHWRFATHGSRGLALCHPFKLPNAEAYLMHNGVIGSTAQDANEDASDTLLYVNKLVDAPVTYRSGDDLTYWNKVCHDIGSHNKAVVMYPDGQFIILNQDHGKLIDDIWYSNQYSLPVEKRQDASYFIPARLRPASTWSGNQGTYYGGYRGGYGTQYTSGLPSGPFGHTIYWSDRFQSYGFWEGTQYHKLEVYAGEIVDPYTAHTTRVELKPDSKPQGTMDWEKAVVTEDERKCPRCLRFKKDPPMGYMICWCTPEAIARHMANSQGQGAAPSGPTLGEHPEEKPAPKPAAEACEHGNDNWENCRECIAEIEADTSDGFKRWLEDRKGHNWRVHTPDNGGHLTDPNDAADEIAEKVIYLPRASEK